MDETKPMDRPDCSSRDSRIVRGCLYCYEYSFASPSRPVPALLPRGCHPSIPLHCSPPPSPSPPSPGLPSPGPPSPNLPATVPRLYCAAIRHVGLLQFGNQPWPSHPEMGGVHCVYVRGEQRSRYSPSLPSAVLAPRRKISRQRSADD